MSHILHVVSAEPVTRVLESSVTSHVHTAPLWPMYVPTRSPSSEYHSVGW